MSRRYVSVKLIFWISSFFIFYAYLGYPLILAFLARRADSRKRMRLTEPIEPSVSVIIPVYNEEKVIGEKIRNTLSLDYPRDKLEILVVSDASTDRTGQIALSFEKEGVRYFHQPTRKGKAGALNRGLREARHEIVVFSDASILLEHDALRRLVAGFADPDVGCISGEDHIPGGGEEGAYGRYELCLRNLESRLGSIVGASGCFYGQRKSLCKPFPEGMAPDFFSVLQTVASGYRAVTEPKARGVMRHVSDPREEFQRKVRTFLRGMTTLLHFTELLNPFRYGTFALVLASHKVVRWSTGFFLILLLASNLFLLDSVFYLGMFLFQGSFYAFALAGWLSGAESPILRVPFFFVMVNLAALTACTKLAAGIRQEIWEPSRR